MFIEPDAIQIQASSEMGADTVELHTGAFANMPAELQQDEVDRLEAAARLAQEKGLLVNAGHGINYSNVRLLTANPHWNEFNIGHSIVSRAISIGLENAVRLMLERLKS
jgi:pyridoxine 5-phosphate synthase